MNRSEQINELAAALVAAQGEFTAIPKSSENPFFKSAYAGLPIVVETASPILTKHGLAVSQLPGIDEHGQDTLSTMLVHKSGQFIEQAMRLHLTKSDAQGQGSALTYARRYAYMAVLGLVADNDDDGNAASRPPAGRQANRNGNQQPSSPSPLLTAEQRDRVLSGIVDKDQSIALILAAMGVGGPDELTAAHAKQIRIILDRGDA